MLTTPPYACPGGEHAAKHASPSCLLGPIKMIIIMIIYYILIIIIII